MATPTDRDRRAASQRSRRMAARVCGNCGCPAELMIPWGSRQTVPICRSCHARLNAVPSDPYCGIYEVSPDVLRPTARPAAIPEETDRPEEDARSGGILRRAWDWLMEGEEEE